MEEVQKYYKIIIELFCSHHDEEPDETIAINEAGSHEQLLAYLCEHYVTHKINENLSGETLWQAFSDFEDFVEKYHKTIKIKDIYSSHIYNWYYGNCVQYLAHLILQPQLYTDNNTLQYSFIHIALRKIYDLLVKYQCPVNVKDYYDTTGYEYLKQMKSSQQTFLYKHQAALLSLLLKHGPNVINIQKDMLKIKVSRLRTRKKLAVSKIENWWFEIINNPYNEVGLKMLMKRAMDFEKKYF